MNNSNSHRFDVKIWDNISRLFYALSGGLLTLLFPIVAFLTIGAVILLTSTIIYSSIRYSLLPKAIIHEPVYFNFATPEPVAKIDILTSNRQWVSIRDSNLETAQKSYFESSRSENGVDETALPVLSPSSSSSSTRSARQDSAVDYKRYLKPAATYTFHSTVLVAKSRRNVELGKFMISLRLFDSTSRVIATSSRPVVVPYQSPLSGALQTLFWFPLVLTGLLHVHEAHSVSVTFMDDFVEPGHMQPSTALVELTLSTAEADVVSTHLTVMPALYGITYVD